MISAKKSIFYDSFFEKLFYDVDKFTIDNVDSKVAILKFMSIETLDQINL